MIGATVPNHHLWAGLNNPLKKIWAPLYVGKSDTSIRVRFRNHCNNPAELMQKARRCFADAGLEFWWVELDPINIREIENALITAFGPPVNKVYSIQAKIMKSVRA